MKIRGADVMDKVMCDCGGESCDNSRIVLTGNCHLGAPCTVIYDKATTSLILRCAVCLEEVDRVGVAASTREVHSDASRRLQ